MRGIPAPTPIEYLNLPERQVADYQTGVAAWVMELSLQMSLLRRNTVKARTMLHHLMSGWGDFPGGTPSREEQLQILNDGLLAQRTVYAAFREYGTLVVGEVTRQQAGIQIVTAAGTIADINRHRFRFVEFGGRLGRGG